MSEETRGIARIDGKPVSYSSPGMTVWDARGLRFVLNDGTELWCECVDEVDDNPKCPMHSRKAVG